MGSNRIRLTNRNVERVEMVLTFASRFGPFFSVGMHDEETLPGFSGSESRDAEREALLEE